MKIIRKDFQNGKRCISAIYANGEKEPILILHPPGVNNSSILPLFRYFCDEGHTVVAPDLRGHGFTSSGPIDAKGITEDIVFLCSRLGISHCVLVAVCISSVLAHLLQERLNLRCVVLLLPGDFGHLRLRGYFIYLLGLLMYAYLYARKIIGIKSTKKKNIDWTYYQDIPLLKYLRLVQRNIDLRYYLTYMRYFLHLSLSMHKIVVPISLFVLDKDEYWNNKRLLRDAFPSEFVRVIQVQSNKHSLIYLFKESTLSIMKAHIDDYINHDLRP